MTFSILHISDLHRDPRAEVRNQPLVADAVADLGTAEEIGQVFTGFQKYLYQRQTAA